MSHWATVLIVTAIGLAVVGVVVLGVAVLLARKNERLVQRMTGGQGAVDGEVGRGRGQWLSRVAGHGQEINQMLEEPAETTVLLARAGWRSAQTRSLFYAAQLLLPAAVVVLAIPIWFGLRAAFGFTEALLLVVGLFIFAILLPRMLLRYRAGHRVERLRAEIPLFINMLILLFEAGLSTRQALTSLLQDGADTLPELNSELRPVLRQLEAGGEVGALLLELSKSLNIEELESIIGILRQVEKYGGEVREPLAEALATIEQRRGMEIREKVNVLSGKMTVVLVLFFLPALLVLVVGPAFTSILAALRNVGGS